MGCPPLMVQRFSKLFLGRLDVVGTDWGECKRVAYMSDDMWIDLFDAHLDVGGQDSIGVYPLMGDGSAAWGCVDIDEDTVEHALNLQTVLRMHDVQAWVERSRSKGYHVWVLTPNEPKVPATLMRKALQAACQIVGCPDREVNPKQTELAEGQVGNYVRLPYPGGWERTDRQVMIGCSLDRFLEQAMQTGPQRPGLHRLADQWIDPHPPVRRHVLPPMDTTADPVRRMSSLAYILWRDGPKFPDRSAAIWRLIVELVSQGAHTEQEIVNLVADADARWGKYQQRPNGRAEIERQVRKAWGSVAARP
jgi:hypothetical protein